jgi:hypothetical protein
MRDEPTPPEASSDRRTPMLDTIDRTTTTGQPLRRPALVAGIGLLLMAVLAGLANFVVLESLVTPGDPATTAADVLGAEGLFRLGTLALLAVAVLDVVVAWGLYAFLAPADAGLSRLAAWLRVAYAAMFAVAVAHLVAVPRLLGDSLEAAGADVARIQAEALGQVELFGDIWDVALAVFGVHLVLVGYLALTSGYVPRLVGALVILAGAGYVFDSVGAMLLPQSAVTVSAVTFLGELVLLVWLLARGRRVVLPTGG